MFENTGKNPVATREDTLSDVFVRSPIASFRQQKPLKKYHYFQDFSDAKNCSKSAIYKNKTVVLVSKYLKITENL